MAINIIQGNHTYYPLSSVVHNWCNHLSVHFIWLDGNWCILPINGSQHQRRVKQAGVLRYIVWQTKRYYIDDEIVY
ncbi:hypothetical protein phiPccP1_00001 [Pectobacterium phage phiPccP-1]|nr:hypothetical protein phiPccP1_00001 [Pectobacterium phage phiPccP-1]